VSQNELNNNDNVTDSSNRRTFLKGAGAIATTALWTGLPRNVHAGGSDVIKVGLVGCGGRGSGAAMQAMDAGEDVRLVAMGDVFKDRLDGARQNLSVNKNFAVDDAHTFVGFDAYQKVIESVDVVLLATPPHFRPMQLEAAIEAGKHVFCEKPMAVDGPGVRRVMAAAQKAKEKKLAVCSGFCYRYNTPTREHMARIHDGAIGPIQCVHVTYNTGGLWMNPRQEGWSDMEWQLRNWLYFTWLSGDHNVEQHVHSLDTASMYMNNEYPTECVAHGGRQARTDPAYGHIFDHHAVVYEYASGARCFAYCRQQPDTHGDVSDWAFGTKGRALKRAFNYHEIFGENPWKFRGKTVDAYQTEHNELFASIRKGEPVNDGDYMAKSTLMGIMGRMASYTGKKITWEMALNSQEVLGPTSYEMGPLPVPPVAIPGKTPFV
jgi:myo-inositol 2-dehydrogenase/D-chiro-inositol 1-dehydrogenase